MKCDDLREVTSVYAHLRQISNIARRNICAFTARARKTTIFWNPSSNFEIFLIEILYDEFVWNFLPSIHSPTIQRLTICYVEINWNNFRTIQISRQCLSREWSHDRGKFHKNQVTCDGRVFLVSYQSLIVISFVSHLIALTVTVTCCSLYNNNLYINVQSRVQTPFPWWWGSLFRGVVTGIP